MYTRMRNHRRRRARKDPFVGWRRDHTLSDRTPAARCGPRRPRRPAWRSEHPPRKYGRDVPSLCGTLPRDRGQRAPSVARSFRVRTSTLWPRSPSLTSGGGRERESYGRCALSVPAPHGQTGRRSLPSSRHTHTQHGAGRGLREQDPWPPRTWAPGMLAGDALRLGVACPLPGRPLPARLVGARHPVRGLVRG